LNVHNKVTASESDFTSLKTRTVLKIISPNMVMKNARNKYLNHLDLSQAGMGLFLERPSFLPSNVKSCPLPQYLLQYALVPDIIEIASGVAKQINPSHANRILKNPRLRYSSDAIHK